MYLFILCFSGILLCGTCISWKEAIGSISQVAAESSNFAGKEKSYPAAEEKDALLWEKG